MEHPFVVCHMLTSLDGKIDGTFFGVPETVPAIKAYGELRSFYGCQATLYGTTTMLGGYAEGKVGQLPTVMSTPPRADWVNPTGKAMGNFIVAVDPQGQLAYSGLSIEKKGRPAAALTVLCRPADEECLALAILRETSTQGVRVHTCRRWTLTPSLRQVETPYGPIGIKTAAGWGVEKCKPEYADVAAAAERAGVPFREVWQAALLAGGAK